MSLPVFFFKLFSVLYDSSSVFSEYFVKSTEKANCDICSSTRCHKTLQEVEAISHPFLGQTLAKFSLAPAEEFQDVADRQWVVWFGL